jgi:RHS repeat-associated protein
MTVLSAAWTPQSDLFNTQVGFQGMWLDQASGLYHTPNRDYSPGLGRWVEQDPVSFVNRYDAMGSNPVASVDPSGDAPAPAPPATGPTTAPSYPHVTIDLSPATAQGVSGMAWSSATLTNNAEGIVGGNTDPAPQGKWVTVVPDGTDNNFCLHATVTVNLTIQIDAKNVKAIYNDGGYKDFPWIKSENDAIEGTYGHEQLHVQGIINYVNGDFGKKWESQLAPYKGLNEDRAKQLAEAKTSLMNLDLSLYLQREMGHPGIPAAGVPYPPIGTMPATPSTAPSPATSPSPATKPAQ